MKQHVRLSQREKLKARADGLCEICSLRANNAHHRRNQSQGGRDDLSNLMLLCGSGTTGCHGYVTEHPNIATWHGWTVQRASQAARNTCLAQGRVGATG